LAAIAQGNPINGTPNTTFTLIVEFTEIILAFGSIIMIFVNMKKCPNVIPGYLLGLGALFLEFFVPFSKNIIAILTECSMHMSAGAKITRNNLSYVKEQKTSKEMIKNTDWFYSSEIKNSDNSKIKKQQKIAKIEKTISQWKELLDLGEIDENTYIEETNKLKEKQKKILTQ